MYLATRTVRHRSFLLIAALGAGACDRAPPATPTPATPATPAAAPVAGAHLGGLGAADRRRFEALADALPSPCGRAHSLRTSRNTDPACRRAPFAVDMLVALIGDGIGDEEVKALHDARFGRARPPRHTFAIDAGVPRRGPVDARVVLVEFFDYGCPICKEFRGVLEVAQAAFAKDVAIVYKQFPVHPGSAGAAQAALAAHRQGKFEEMSALLFADQHAHARADLDRHARALGLDMERFAADFDAAAATIEADRAEGKRAGVAGTPSLFFDGAMWPGPAEAKYLEMWIAEALALTSPEGR